ncbi:hypothetical protein ABZY44_25260 [Streptomyces sp. NPDC006544]|uniref:hypothetical protein n=1 Tax=Streptomyces sp. NPDC006544 TaxID=3154583 RepID=UPI0033B88417
MSPEKNLLRLVDVCPDLVGEIVALLRDSHPGDPISDSISSLPVHGICRNYVLTAPDGTPSPWVIALEREAETVFLLGVDPSQSVVTWVDVLDGRDPPAALLRQS